MAVFDETRQGLFLELVRESWRLGLYEPEVRYWYRLANGRLWRYCIESGYRVSIYTGGRAAM